MLLSSISNSFVSARESVDEVVLFRQPILQTVQRQWYFKNIVASGTARRDEFRRRAYILSKLQSVSAWRGKIVDDVISELIVPSLNRKTRITLRDVKTRARQLFDQQLAFARANSPTDLTLQPSKHKESFALFYDNHYGKGVSDEEIERAWAEIEAAFDNLFGLGAVKNCLSPLTTLWRSAPSAFL